CLSCYYGCPYEARVVVDDDSPRGHVRIEVNGVPYEVPDRITVKEALTILGFKVGVFPGEGDVQAPCGTGGCYTCLVLVDGEYRRACVTPIEHGMKIELKPPGEGDLRRVVHGPQPHMVGGKATPWNLKRRGRYVEVAIWAAGCNLRCPQCQNWEVTYDGVSEPTTPQQAAEALTAARLAYDVDRMAISGGEPTINRRWLTSFFRHLRRLNPDPKARLHLDSNGTVLTPDYIDELVEAGVTDIGVEPKGVRVETFMHITGVQDRELAARYLENSWRAIKYIVDNYYPEKVFLGVGLPYNRELISMEEVHDFGLKLASIHPEVQLCVLDYFPAFRRRGLKRPSPSEMLEVKRVLESAGLKTVIVQTSIGHIGP
ncbi:radical SAM protein, partial [Candidatus Geothermarchaeota archaeon ex4572_27]